MRSRLLEEVLERFCEMLQTGGGLDFILARAMETVLEQVLEFSRRYFAESRSMSVPPIARQARNHQTVSRNLASVSLFSDDETAASTGNKETIQNHYSTI